MTGRRQYGDGTFSAGDVWYLGEGPRMRLGGVVISDNVRGDVMTLGGSVRASTESPPKVAPPRPPRARKIPMIYLPPRRN